MTTETPPARPRVKWRRGYQPPPIVNLGLGVIMLLAGVIFFVVGAGGGQGSYRFVLLFLYLLIAAFYLSKAARQYRAKRQA